MIAAFRKLTQEGGSVSTVIPASPKICRGEESEQGFLPKIPLIFWYTNSAAR